MKRLLVTGRYGFVGSTLAREVETQPALAHWRIVPTSEQLDILDADAVRDLVAADVPDAVVHLAARSSVADSFKEPGETIRVNLLGTLNLLQALDAVGFQGPMLFVSSGDIYGRVPEDALPISERQLPAPRNPYAVSKLAAEALCFQWSLTGRMKVIIARPFNHIGPGQGMQFALPAFARQIADIRKGIRPPVVAVGDIDVTRDITDVRDIVAAYFALLDGGVNGEVYNVCSGRERTVRSLLERLIHIGGVKVDIVRDEARVRPAEQRRAVGDPAKIREAVGWSARIPLDRSLTELLHAYE